MVARLTRSLVMLLAGVATFPSVAAADAAAAARYYEDGLTRFNGGDVPGAIVQLKNALQQDNRMLAAQVLLAKALLGTGEYAAAEAAFADAIKMGVDRSEVAVPYGGLMLELGRPKILLQQFSAEGMPAPVARDLLQLRARALFDTGEPAEAFAAIERAKALFPSAAGPYVTEAGLHLRAGRAIEALRAAEHGVKLAPDDATAWHVRASVDHAAGRLEDALKAYGRAIEIRPDYIDARIARAGVLIDLGRDADAQADVDVLVERGQVDARASYLKALLASRAGDAKSADSALRSVQILVGKLPAEWVASREEYLMLGALSNHAMGNFEAASGYLDTLMKAYPRNSGARRLLAAVQIEQRDSARALDTLDPVLRAAPDDPTALYLAGRAYLQRGNHSRAQRLLERAAELGATPDIFRALAESQVARGNREASIAALRRALDARPDDLGVGFMLAIALMREGKVDAARGVLDGLARHAPGHPGLVNLQGSIAASSGDLSGARSRFEAALAADARFLAPALNLVRLDRAESRLAAARKRIDALLGKYRNHPDVLFEAGLLTQAEGRVDAAVALLRKAVDADPGDLARSLHLIDVLNGMRRPADALEIAKGLAIRRPGNLEVLAVLGRTNLAAGDRRSALQAYQDMTKTAEFDAAAQARIGALNLEAGAIDAAAYNVQKALTADAGSLAAKGLAGRVAMARGEFMAAAEIARALQRQPESRLDGLRLGADAALAAGRGADAVRMAQEVLTAEPQAANAVALARLQARAGQRRAAVATCDEWLLREPSHAGLAFELAQLHVVSADWAAARTVLERLRTLIPNEAAIHNNLALVLLELNDPGAEASAREALRLSPEAPLALDTLGWVLARRGDPEQALRYLRDALIRQPDSGEVRWHLAYALDRLGRRDEARLEAQAAVASRLAFRGIDEARALLAR